MTAPDALRRGALAALREGRVTVTVIDGERMVVVVDSSRGNGVSYLVDRWPDRWECTCKKSPGCAHIAAARMVTDHGSGAGA